MGNRTPAAVLARIKLANPNWTFTKVEANGARTGVVPASVIAERGSLLAADYPDYVTSRVRTSYVAVRDATGERLTFDTLAGLENEFNRRSSGPVGA